MKSFWPTLKSHAVEITLGALAILARALPGLRTIDDAYITFRYSRNLLAGAGFVYNPGEAVLGTTTPLYTLLMAGLAGLTGSGDFPQFAVIVNALADAVTAALLYRLARQLLDSRVPALALGVLWTVSPMSVTFAIGGMETSVGILWMVAAFSACLAERTWLAAFFAALALLTRPDTLIWVGPLALEVLIRALRERRFPWTEAAWLVVPVTPWILFATLTFGGPLPNSVAAKAVAYALPPTQALERLIQHYATPFFEHRAFRIPAIGIVGGLALYPALAAIGGLKLVRDDARTWPLVAYPWLYFATFAIANPLIFRWYLAPPLPFYFLCILAGIWTLTGTLRAERWRVAVPAALYAGMLAMSLNVWTPHPDHGPDRPTPEMAWHKLELLYEGVGRELAPDVTAETVVAAGDIGAIGYFSGAEVLDTLGLISPQAVSYYPIDPSMLATTGYAVAPDLIFDERPDYIVVLETYVRNGLLLDPRFGEVYVLREKITTDIYGSDGMLVYEVR
jgi:hypothetical protein